MIDAGIAALVAIIVPFYIASVLRRCHRSHSRHPSGLGGTAGLAVVALCIWHGSKSCTCNDDWPSICNNNIRHAFLILMGIPELQVPGLLCWTVPARQRAREQSTICGVYFLNVCGSFWSSCSLGAVFRNADNARCRIW